jgi:hypothetical protein
MGPTPARSPVGSTGSSYSMEDCKPNKDPTHISLLAKENLAGRLSAWHFARLDVSDLFLRAVVKEKDTNGTHSGCYCSL